MPKDVASKINRVDFWLTFGIFILAIFGLIMVYSASTVMSIEEFGEGGYFFRKQLFSLGLGIIVWAFISNTNYHFWKKIAKTFLIISFFFLFLVFIPGISFGYGGAHRWISLGPLFFQPSELFKLAFIIFLAFWFDERKADIKSKNLYLSFLGLLAFSAFFIVVQRDLGTLVIIGMIALMIYFIAGARLRYLAYLIGFGFLAVLVLIKVEPYRLARLTAFLNPSADPSGIGYQINQALIAIGSGGVWGLGFGQSIQKTLYLPEAATDSIFAIIAEEMGFIRVLFLIFLFTIIALRGYKIAKLAPDFFGKVLAGGITSWFTFQAFINIAAMLALVPLTGIPLPFLSYGGSSLIVSLTGVGILLNISRFIVGEEHYESDYHWWWNWWTHFSRSFSSRRVKKTRR